MCSMAVTVADQVVVAGAGKCLSMVRHMGDKYLATGKFQRSLFSVIGKYADIVGHHAIQCGDVIQIVAVHGMNGKAQLEGCA